MRFGALPFELAGKLAHPVPSFPGDSDDENTILNFGEYVLVIAINNPTAITLATLTPFECSELGAPRATKIMDLGRDKMTVII